MSTNENGLNSREVQPVKTLSKRTTHFIASCARLKGALNGFYLDLGIGADSILLAVLMAVYLIWRAA